ncbi:ATP-binding protein [Nitrosophilus labii]|uniref:ATP-binding protein n=1 Tax=Nitrosophilus labii TaxID=2706014 RepID=UPI0016573746|nr:ATP-binding protein [Nitrosophilus labii]
MLRLNQIFFYHLTLLLSILFFVVSTISYFALKNIEIEHYQKTLQNSIILIESQITGSNNLDGLVKNIKSLTNQRITVIDGRGKVIAESDFDKNEMENHANRPEIKEARENGWGSSIRYSSTLKENLLYVAKKSYKNSEPVYIRAAITLKTIQNNFYALWLKFLAVFGFFILFSLGVSYFLSKKIKMEINKIINFLDSIAKKEYKKSLKVNFAKEFEEIGEYLRNLTKKLQKREEKKEKFTKKLKQISRQRSELISAISHEFKNPVAIINGYTQALLEDDSMDEKLRRKFLEKIYNASNKISNMIDRLSIAIKFENNDLEPKKSEFDICYVVKDAVKLMKDKYKNREIVIKCEPYKVIADKTMIEMVLINLIDNALKYSETDVKVEIKEGEIRVIDKGIGIKNEDIEKITRKFYRARRNSWDNSMGLGLYLVSYILELHGSKLKIDSEYGKGSIFSFRL